MGQQGGTTLVFSVDAATYGLIQSYDVEENTKRATAMGPGGDTVSVQEHDNLAALSLTYLQLGSPTGLPVIGTTFSFRDKTWYLDSVTSGYTVDGFLSVDVEATEYPNLP